MAAQPLKVPTMWIQGLWDQEDMWGAIHSYLAVEPKDATNDDELSGDGTVAPQRRELRRLDARPAEVERRHGAAVPARRAQAVLRSVSEGRRAEGRHAAGVHLQHRREPLGSPEELAAGVRERAAPTASKPLYLTAGFGLSFTAPTAQSGRPRLRRVRLRSGQAGAVSAASGPLRRRRLPGGAGC